MKEEFPQFWVPLFVLPPPSPCRVPKSKPPQNSVVGAPRPTEPSRDQWDMIGTVYSGQGQLMDLGRSLRQWPSSLLQLWSARPFRQELPPALGQQHWTDMPYGLRACWWWKMWAYRDWREAQVREGFWEGQRIVYPLRLKVWLCFRPYVQYLVKNPSLLQQIQSQLKCTFPILLHPESLPGHHLGMPNVFMINLKYEPLPSSSCSPTFSINLRPREGCYNNSTSYPSKMQPRPFRNFMAPGILSVGQGVLLHSQWSLLLSMINISSPFESLLIVGITVDLGRENIDSKVYKGEGF